MAGVCRGRETLEGSVPCLFPTRVTPPWLLSCLDTLSLEECVLDLMGSRKPRHSATTSLRLHGEDSPSPDDQQPQRVWPAEPRMSPGQNNRSPDRTRTPRLASSGAIEAMHISEHCPPPPSHPSPLPPEGIRELPSGLRLR